ncbi:MAG: FAD-dependent oxidoreductase, partial [Dehalococcoidales bacterium]
MKPSSAPTHKGQALPPCQAACPIHQDVQGYTAFISQGRFDDALAVIRQTNPLPSTCGFVCAQPCQADCRRDSVDQAIAIRALKRAAVEYGRSRPAVTGATYDEKVAVIGSGPAGMACAYDLALLGYPVTVYEAASEAGGLLRY